MVSPLQEDVQNSNGAPTLSTSPAINILLVKPYWLWGSYPEASPPMGLLYLSSSVKHRFPHARTRLLDLRLELDKKKSLIETIEHFKPDLVAFLCLTGDKPILEKLTRTVKEVDSSIHICCGGPYPSHCPEDFTSLHHVDSIIRGEGEHRFPDLLEHLFNSTNAVASLPSGIGLRSTSGDLTSPGYSPYIDNLDQIPFPDWDLLDIDLYSNIIQTNAILAGKRYMPVFTSRGCPFHCMYCHNMFGKTIRMRSPENIVNEISILVKKYHVEEIQIYDDIFNVNRDRVLLICDLIIRQNLHIKVSFPNGLRGDMLDDDLIHTLKRAGVYMITFAIETASPRIQRLIRKNLDIDKVIKAISCAHNAGLITRGFFMIGFPTETEDDIKKTLRLAVRLPLTTFSIFSVIPFKGTTLFNLALKNTNYNGRKLLEDPAVTYFSPKTYFTETTGINLRQYILFTYFSFFTPFRLIRYFIKIPRKNLYLKLLTGLLKIGFSNRKDKFL